MGAKGEKCVVFVVSGDVFVALFTRASGAPDVSVVCDVVLRFAVKGRRKGGGRVQALSAQTRFSERESIGATL